MNQTDTGGLERAGVKLVFAALWPPLATRARRDPLGEALNQLRELRAFVRGNPRFAIVADAEAARRAVNQGKIALVPALEGGEGIGSLEDVDLLYAAGVRSIGLVHFTANRLASAEAGQFGALLSVVLDRADGGLTPLGTRAVRRMMELGIVVDVAHASDRTIDDVLRLAAEQRVPIIDSHAGQAMKRDRTLSDEAALRIAEGGGLVGIGVYRHPLLHAVPEEDRFPDYRSGSCDEVIANWLHFGARVGFDNVVLGSDFSSPILRAEPGGGCPQGLRNTGDLPALFAALEKRGVPRLALESRGERVLKLWQQVERRSSPERREAARALRAPSEDLFDVSM